MLITTDDPQIDGSSLVACATSSGLLNTYLREIAAFDPAAELARCSLAELPPDMAAPGPPAQAVRLRLPAAGAILFAWLGAWSASGHHRFGGDVWAAPAAGGPARRLDGPRDLAALLIAEVAAAEPDRRRRAERQEGLLRAIDNSLEKTAIYLAAAADRPRIAIGADDGFRAAEQGLLLGHPFHPTPKSSEGWSGDDLRRYAPELGASFTLHYVAADPALVVEEFLPGARSGAIPVAVEREARRLGVAGDWALLPVHPWQAGYLGRQPAVAAAVAADRLRFLGGLGGAAYPTSSVRTVIDPAHSCFFKLPLNVRITNFVRVNTAEQLRRSLDASRALAAASAGVDWPGFRIMRELGYRTIRLGQADDPLADSFAVLFREKPFALDGAAPLVLASLLETCPATGAPPIAQALRQAAGLAQPDGALVGRWLRRYLDIALLPVLGLFVQRGVSLEAHVQNTLVAFDRGWPARAYVRDLEGASISRELADDGGWYRGVLADDSPALYPEDQAWHRLKYYVVVNQLSHVVATLGHATPVAEETLWQIVRHWLLEQTSLTQSARGRRYVSDLVDSATLPAKANLISRFQERGETPAYVPIPNPLGIR